MPRSSSREKVYREAAKRERRAERLARKAERRAAKSSCQDDNLVEPCEGEESA